MEIRSGRQLVAIRLFVEQFLDGFTMATEAKEKEAPVEIDPLQEAKMVQEIEDAGGREHHNFLHICQGNKSVFGE